MKKSILAMLLLTQHSFTDDAPAGGDGAQPTTVAVTVPAEHLSLVTRLLAVLEKDATWVKDNVEAGITHLENMFKSEAAASTGAQAAVQTDAPAVSQNGPASIEQ